VGVSWATISPSGFLLWIFCRNLLPRRCLGTNRWNCILVLSTPLVLSFLKVSRGQHVLPLAGRGGYACMMQNFFSHVNFDINSFSVKHLVAKVRYADYAGRA
jgi:hypothetical protein